MTDFVRWLTLERFSIAAAAFYGLFVLSFHSFALSAPWASMRSAVEMVGIAPEWLFSSLLLSCAALQGYGLKFGSSAFRMWGAGCGFTAFFIALVSQVVAAPTGTGVPAYLILSGLYLLLVLCRAFGIERVSLRF